MITLLLLGSAVLIYFWGILSLYLWLVFSLSGDSFAYGIASFSGDFHMWWDVYHNITPPFLRSFSTQHTTFHFTAFPLYGIARPLMCYAATPFVIPGSYQFDCLTCYVTPHVGRQFCGREGLVTLQWCYKQQYRSLAMINLLLLGSAVLIYFWGILSLYLLLWLRMTITWLVQKTVKVAVN